MSITAIIAIVAIVVAGGGITWIGIKSKKGNKKIDKAKEVLIISKSNDKVREKAIAEIDKRIKEIQANTLENETLILDLREQSRKAKDENIKAKKKDEVRDAINKRNRLKTAERRAKIEKEKLS